MCMCIHLCVRRCTCTSSLDSVPHAMHSGMHEFEPSSLNHKRQALAVPFAPKCMNPASDEHRRCRVES